MATIPNWPILAIGSSGYNVYALQSLLAYRGFYTAIDGDYGNNTKSAVTAFQQNRGLSADGVAGPNTLTALVVYVSKPATNMAAKAAQFLLHKFESIAIDGSFGNYSEQMTRLFQQKMGITVTGAVNPLTWRYLFGYNSYQTVQWYSSNSALTVSQMQVNAQYILNYLRDRGWTKNAICGMLGNMEVESTINPGAWNGFVENSPAYGLVQWNPTSKYFDWADANGMSYPNMNNQLQRIIYEKDNDLQYCQYGTPYSFADYSVSTDTAANLGKAFAWHYEDGSLSDDAAAYRGQLAQNWYDLLE